MSVIFFLYFCVKCDGGYIKVAEACSADVKNICCVVNGLSPCLNNSEHNRDAISQN